MRLALCIALAAAACAAPAAAPGPVAEVRIPSATAEPVLEQTPVPIDPCRAIAQVLVTTQAEIASLNSAPDHLRATSLALHAGARELWALDLKQLNGWRDSFAIRTHQLAVGVHLSVSVTGEARTRLRKWMQPLMSDVRALAQEVDDHCKAAPRVDPPRADEALPSPSAGHLLPSDHDETLRLYALSESYLAAWRSTASGGGTSVAEVTELFDRWVARTERMRLSRPRAIAMRTTLIDMIKHMSLAMRTIKGVDKARDDQAQANAQADATVIGMLVQDMRDHAWGTPPSDDVPFIRERCNAGDAHECYMLALALMASDREASKLLAARACRVESRACVLVRALEARDELPKTSRRGFEGLERYCREANGAACFLLARELDSGERIDRDRGRALELLSRVCRELGGEMSCKMLGEPTYVGDGRAALRHACDHFGTLSACLALDLE